jgi:hypothetical protein
MARLMDVTQKDVDATIEFEDAEERARLKAEGYRWTGKVWRQEFASLTAAREAVVSMVRDHGYLVFDGDSIARVADWLESAGMDYDEMPVVARAGLSGSDDLKRVPADYLRSEVERRRAKLAAQ